MSPSSVSPRSRRNSLDASTAVGRAPPAACLLRDGTCRPRRHAGERSRDQPASDLQRAQARAGYLFLLPSFALYLVFVLAPVVVTCILSFTFYDPMLGSRWVGFDNYVRFFTDDRSLQIFWNTLRFTVFAVTGNICVGMLFALALDRRCPGDFPLSLSARLFPPGDHRGGLRVDRLGLFLRRRSRRHQLLPHPAWLQPGPLADLQPQRDDVDRHHGRLEERRLLHDHLHRRAAGRAEDADGGGGHGRRFPWRRFFRIVLPWISPVVFFAIVYASIGALQVFESVVILTRGGPGDATRSMSIFIVEEAFDSFEIGYAASIAVVMTVVILVITVVQFWRRAPGFVNDDAVARPRSGRSTGRSSPCMAALGVFMLLPFAWLFSMSFRTVRTPTGCRRVSCRRGSISTTIAAVLTSSVPFLQIYANSVEVAVIVTVGQLVTCTLAAFAFARLKFPGRDSLFFVDVDRPPVPGPGHDHPDLSRLRASASSIGPIGLALMYLTSSFGVFLVRQFMRSQPKALEEAALMDGAGYLKIFFRISLPQLRPALAALGIITFTQTWNYYFQARVLLEPQDSMTLPIAMDVLRGYLGSGNLALVMAAMSMSVLPVILLFLLAQRMVIEGIALSGIKT